MTLKSLLLFQLMSQWTQQILSLIHWRKLFKTFLQEELKSQRTLIPSMSSNWKSEGELVLVQLSLCCITCLHVCKYWYNIAIMNEVLLLSANGNWKSNPIFPLKMYSTNNECNCRPSTYKVRKRIQYTKRDLLMSFNLSPSFEEVVAVIPIPNQGSCAIKVVSKSACRVWPKTYWTEDSKQTIIYILKVIHLPVFTCNSLYLAFKQDQVLQVFFPVHCVIVSTYE